MSLVANWIIIDYGWRTAFLFSGITVLVVVIPVILFLIRTHPSECGLKSYRRSDHHSEASADNWGVSVKKARSLRVFWQIGGIMFIVSFVQGGLGNHCVAYLTDIGHSQTQAATAWSLVMWVMVLGKLALGPFADRCGAKNAMASACALLGVSIALVLFAESYWIVIAFASIYGFACGAPLTLNPLLTAGNLGMKNFGAIYGILNVLSTVGGAIGPVIAGEVFDKRGTYQPIFIVFIGLIAVAGLLAVTMKSSPRPATLTEPVRSGGAVD
jgi:sugar phosphate permease